MNKLYRLYIVLAALIVLTTTFGLVVQKSVMSAYDASAAASSRFVSHKAAYDHLRGAPHLRLPQWTQRGLQGRWK